MQQGVSKDWVYLVRSHRERIGQELREAESEPERGRRGDIHWLGPDVILYSQHGCRYILDLPPYRWSGSYAPELWSLCDALPSWGAWQVIPGSGTVPTWGGDKSGIIKSRNSEVRATREISESPFIMRWGNWDPKRLNDIFSPRLHH